ncbi:polyprenyl synthetase family protein [Alishewanella tabrizica]|uniref:Polyprenyl synthetase n=1 Tax=Alishewanella tabrizica TaxID=671278 RepID=A0ABQ2WHH0_9ALTE|nr:polyprenyl synthetase family protein [Alishewanella tabrizica]GGW51903.1 hypothetical protein GCM10008111_04750 [Alishewanella tabrizica]
MSKTDLANHHIYHDMLEQCEALILHKVANNAPASFHLASGGSRTRAKLCINAGIALQLPSHAIFMLAGAIELLHNASLIHDDLQDNDESRRGVESLWIKFGKGHAMCAGDLMISAAYSLIANIKPIESISALFTKIHDAVASTIEGQDLDLKSQNSMLCEQEYENIAALKSGPLIQLTLTLPLLMAGFPQYISSAEQAISQFAIAYQILDDIDDWQQDLHHSQLNLVNLLALNTSHQQALFIACSRAHFLLKQCQSTLSAMPHHSAASIIETATKMIAKTDRILMSLPKGELLV